MSLKMTKPTEEHKAFHQALREVINQHRHLPAIDLLMITSQLVGALIVLQDQGIPQKELTDMVGKNMEAGALFMVSQLIPTDGTS